MSVELLMVMLVVRFSFWFWCFSFAFLLAFPERVDLHPVIICARATSSWHGRIRYKVSEKRHCWQMYPTANCSQENRWHIHHHCVFDCVCQRSSRSAFPFSDIQLTVSQARFKTFSVVTKEFRRLPDLVRQSVLSILSVWRISVVCQTPCSAPLDGFLNRSDRSSDTVFRCQHK